MAEKGTAKFSEPALLVLVSLSDGPKHGYAMVEDIHRVAGVRLGPGTLYGAISRLEARRLIRSLPEQARRKPYEVTEAGRRTLAAQLGDMKRVADTGLRRLAPI